MAEYNSFRDEAKRFAEEQKSKLDKLEGRDSGRQPSGPAPSQDEWRPVPAELVSQFQRPLQPQVEAPEPIPEIAIDPNALMQMFGLLTGQANPQVAPEADRQLGAAPQHHELEAGPSDTTVRGSLVRREPLALPASGSPSQEEASRKRLDRMRGFTGRHRRATAAVLAISALATVAGGWKVMTGGTAGDAISMVKQEFTSTKYKDTVLPSVDCLTQLTTASMKGMGDIAMKYYTATKADLEKLKKDPKFKVPTEAAFLPPLDMYKEILNPNPTDKTTVPRYPKVVVTNEVSFKACDPTKGAFKFVGDEIVADLSKINLTATFPVPKDEGSPAHAVESHERQKINFNEAAAKEARTLMPGEVERMQKFIGATEDSTENLLIIDAFKSILLDSANEGQCKTDIRTQTWSVIKARLEAELKKQGVVNIPVIRPANDFKMPGEVYRTEKNPVQLVSKDAEIRNAQTSCSNVRLAEGATK